MKIHHYTTPPPSFTPITITLESEDELRCLLRRLNLERFIVNTTECGQPRLCGCEKGADDKIDVPMHNDLREYCHKHGIL